MDEKKKDEKAKAKANAKEKSKEKVPRKESLSSVHKSFGIKKILPETRERWKREAEERQQKQRREAEEGKLTAVTNTTKTADTAMKEGRAKELAQKNPLRASNNRSKVAIGEQPSIGGCGPSSLQNSSGSDDQQAESRAGAVCAVLPAADSVRIVGALARENLCRFGQMTKDADILFAGLLQEGGKPQLADRAPTPAVGSQDSAVAEECNVDP
jgi:hypothetical protein